MSSYDLTSDQIFIIKIILIIVIIILLPIPFIIHYKFNNNLSLSLLILFWSLTIACIIPFIYFDNLNNFDNLIKVSEENGEKVVDIYANLNVKGSGPYHFGPEKESLIFDSNKETDTFDIYFKSASPPFNS